MFETIDFFICCSLYAFIRVSKGSPEELLPAKDVSFEVHIETQPLRAYRAIGRALRAYKDEVKGPTVLVVQSLVGTSVVPLFY